MKPDYYCKEREVFTMAFAKKTWKDRIAEFPTRRRLTKEDNTSELVTVAREEGTLSQEGDAFSAENMNDLENRIDAEFTELNGKLETFKKYILTGTGNAYKQVIIPLPDGVNATNFIWFACHSSNSGLVPIENCRAATTTSIVIESSSITNGTSYTFSVFGILK